MRWKQHERKCEICGNTYLFYEESTMGMAKIPDLMLYGNHPTMCPECATARVEHGPPPVEDEIRSHLDAMKEEVEEKAGVSITPGGEEVEGYSSGPSGGEPTGEEEKVE